MSRVYYPECQIVIQAILETHGKSQRPVDFPAIPRSVSIVRNSYKQPDSWSIEFDAKDFPIPPALVRTAAVEIYLFNKLGLLQERSTIRQTTKPAIVGLIDDFEISYSSSGRSVRMSGQDYTALFSEHSFLKRRNFTGKRLDLALDELRKEVDVTNAMRLVTEIPFDRKRLPVIGKSVSRTNSKGFPVKREENYWDVMYNLALKHGFILFVRDLDLVLATPEDVQEASRKDPSRTFKLSWGQDVEEISISRNMGKERLPQIEVVSYDEKTRKPLVGRFPESKQKVTVGVGTKRNEVMTVTLRGVTSEQLLKRAAKTVYTLIAQSEQNVELKTRELLDENGTDLLHLKAGDVMFVTFDPFNREELRKMPEGQRSEWLVQRGFTRQAANEFSSRFDQLNTFKEPFYVREASIDWSESDGLSLEVSLSNFVTKGGVQESGETKGVAESV